MPPALAFAPKAGAGATATAAATAATAAVGAAGTVAAPPATAPASPWRIAPAARRLSCSAIRELLKVTERPEILSFAGGLPNPASFPVDALREATARVFAENPAAALQYGPTEGYGLLREQIAARLGRTGQRCSPAEVLITTGSQQALDLIGKALLHQGASVLATNPSYLGALQAFALQQPRLVELAGEWVRPRQDPPTFCYLTPSFANPTGETLDEAARHHLMARLDAVGVPLVEDDAYGELWLDAPPPAACRSLAPESTLYLGSFSKVLAPGLRVGFVAGPRRLIEVLTRLKQAADLHTPGLDQRLVSALLADGTLETHLPALRTLYRTQRDALLAALERHFRPYAEWSAPAGGMFAWLRLRPGLDAGVLFEAALVRQVAFVPGAPFYFAAPDRRTLRLAFATLSPAELELGVSRLAEAAATVG